MMIVEGIEMIIQGEIETEEITTEIEIGIEIEIDKGVITIVIGTEEEIPQEIVVEAEAKVMIEEIVTDIDTKKAKKTLILIKENKLKEQD